MVPNIMYFVLMLLLISETRGNDASDTFPNGFIWSSATASYQVEGGWNSDGKGENIWDNFTHSHPEKISHHNNGDVADDSYHHYKEDVQLLKNIGFGMYRFSVSWSRILPNGDLSFINRPGINYYHNLIDELLANGIQPMVTIYHWDLPQKLEDVGGWLNSSIVDYITDYANILFREYGDKVKWWITINEPQSIIQGYSSTFLAPALNLDSPANYIVAHNLLRSHGKIYRLYEKSYRTKQNGKISLSSSMSYQAPKSNASEDRDAAERAMQFSAGLFAHPIYSKEGGYPPIVRMVVDANSQSEGRNVSRLPRFTDEEKAYIKGSYDFFAVNHYTTALCTPAKPPFQSLIAKDVGATCIKDPSWPSSHARWLKVVPWGIREVLRWISGHYGNLRIFVTENGYCDAGEINDIKRVKYYKAYLTETLKAMNKYNCNVIGYTAWSLLDNFEWLDGYEYVPRICEEEKINIKKQ